MTYLITFLEGLITFISPCLLPMLPVYVAYFAGGKGEQKRSPFWKALAFVLGFTVTFGVLGAFAGTVGGLLRRYHTEVNLICGLLVILFGLNFLGVIRLNIFRGTGGMGQNTEMGIFSTILLGLCSVWDGRHVSERFWVLHLCWPHLRLPGHRDPASVMLFRRSGNPFSYQCCADTEAENDF